MPGNADWIIAENMLKKEYLLISPLHNTYAAYPVIFNLIALKHVEG
jgi:hypothetical protein